ETRAGHLYCIPHQAKSDELEKIVVGNVLYAGNIVLKKLREALAGDLLRGLFHTGGVREIPMLLGVLVVHPVKEIAKRLCAIGHLADAQVEHDPEDLTFVVVADAAFRRPVEWNAFEPRVEARLLRRLPCARWPPLQLRNLRRDAGQVLRLI